MSEVDKNTGNYLRNFNIIEGNIEFFCFCLFQSLNYEREKYIKKSLRKKYLPQKNINKFLKPSLHAVM